MCTDEIGALTQRVTGEAHGLLVTVSKKPGVGRNSHVEGRIGIARTEAQRAAGCLVAVLPAPAVGQRQAVVALSQCEVRIEPKSAFEFGK